ncbi:unnamed protein product, partial [Ilex paraguariensis]
WFLHFIVTAFIVAFGLLYLLKVTASKYFVVDANFDESESVYSSSTTTTSSSSSAGYTSSSTMPGFIGTHSDSCIVCGNLTKKHCSGCKMVKY